MIIKDESGTPVFGGYIATLSLDDEQKSYATQVKVTLALRNYRILTDTAALLTKSYTIQADNAIIVDAFATSALADITVDIANLVNISTLTASFSNNTLTEVMDQICSATGGAWFIDASKVLHYVNPVY